MPAILELSTYIPNLTALPTSLTAAALLILGIIVMSRERGSSVSVSFLVLTIFVSGWLLSLSLMYCTESAEAALHFARMAYVCIPLIPASIYQFTTSLLRLKNQRRAVACWVFWLSFAVVIPSSKLFLVGVYRYEWGFYPRLAGLSVLYLAFFGLTLAASLRLLIVEYRAAPEGHARDRIREFLVAFVVGYLGAVDYLGSFGIDLYPVGFVAIAGFLILSARAVWRHHLVDLTPQYAASEILQTMQGAVLVTDVFRRIQVANRAAIEMLGYSREELCTKSISEIDTSTGIFDGSDTLSRGGAIRDRPMAWRRADGFEVEVAVSASPLVGENQKIVGTVYVGVDIADLRRAERSIASLSRQNQLILQAAGEAICGLDLAGNFTFVNPAAARLTGWNTSQLIGKSHHDLLHPRHPDGSPYPIGECTILRSLRERKTSIAEEVFWTRDGRDFPVEYISTPMLEDDTLVGAVVTFNDITSRKTAEEQRERILRAEEANRTKDEFLATVSHDLRSPLTAILGWVQIARKEASKPTVVTALNWIAYSAQMQTQLVGDLVDVSRIVRGALSLSVTAEKLDQIAREVVESIEPLAEQKQIAIVFSAPEDQIDVQVDAHRIRQVLWNLMSNAIKFTPRRGTVRMEVDKAGDTARISVVDTGCGIEADFLPYVFDPYRQARRSGTHEGGLGLGLAIARNLVTLHGGTIAASSLGEGQGSTFTIELPMNGEVGESADSDPALPGE